MLHAYLLVSGLRFEDAAAPLDYLNVGGLIGPWSSSDQVAVLNHQRQEEYSYHNRQHRKSDFSNALT